MLTTNQLFYLRSAVALIYLFSFNCCEMSVCDIPLRKWSNTFQAPITASFQPGVEPPILVPKHVLGASKSKFLHKKISFIMLSTVSQQLQLKTAVIVTVQNYGKNIMTLKLLGCVKLKPLIHYKRFIIGIQWWYLIIMYSLKTEWYLNYCNSIIIIYITYN